MSNQSNFQIGERCTWLKTFRGGYGYVYPVGAVVTAINQHSGRVQIEVKKVDGSLVKRWVKLDNLRKHAEVTK